MRRNAVLTNDQAPDIKKSTHLKKPVIGVSGLALIYILLCALMILVVEIFFEGVLWDGRIPDQAMFSILLILPALLCVFFVMSLASLIHSLVTRKISRRFQLRLLGYFTVILLFTALPLFIITRLSLGEIMKFWEGLNMEAVVNDAQNVAMNFYFDRVEAAEQTMKTADFDGIFTGTADPPEGLLAAQDFIRTVTDEWLSVRFWGKGDARLDAPPLVSEGVITREKPRDTDVFRYSAIISGTNDTSVRIATFSLGENFDRTIDAFENSQVKFAILKQEPGFNYMVLFYAVFFMPVILMTLVIAMSFTQNVTSPLLELTEATQRVAAGDLSIHITAKRKDEFRLLIDSFNMMVNNLEKTRNHLIENEKRSIWRDMAAKLAHEIKNALTPVNVSAGRVLRKCREDPARIGDIAEDCMLTIIQDVDGIIKMLNEFRSFSRPMEPSVSICNVKDVAETIAESYRLSCPDVEFRVDNIEPDAVVKINERRLSQVITNLLVNAIDAVNAVDAEKRIEIRTDAVRKQGTAFCRITVADTGEGILPDTAPKLFDPYFTTKEDGTGLGLAIVERIVKDHGGFIWFNSKAGTGTSFFVELPAAGEKDAY